MFQYGLSINTVYELQTACYKTSSHWRSRKNTEAQSLLLPSLSSCHRWIITTLYRTSAQLPILSEDSRSIRTFLLDFNVKKDLSSVCNLIQKCQALYCLQTFGDSSKRLTVWCHCSGQKGLSSFFQFTKPLFDWIVWHRTWGQLSMFCQWCVLIYLFF